MLRTPAIIRSLHYFEAVARHGSITRAAEELGVTQSAVSHRLRDLSRVLGEQLFTRTGRGIELTSGGRQLAERLTLTFKELAASVESMIGRGAGTVRLAVCSSFGPGWLIPRLARFSEEFPDIDLELRLQANDPDLTDSVADAFVTADTVPSGFVETELFAEMLVAVENPKMDGATPVRLITTDVDETGLGREWITYGNLIDRRLGELDGQRWICCSHYIFALEMARSGLGVALVPDFLAERPLADGAVRLFDPRTMPSGRTYRLCFKEARGADPSLVALRNWFRRQLDVSSS